MKQLTVKELRKLLQEAEKQGYGDRLLVTADNEEGNGYHGIWYGCTPGENLGGCDICDTESQDLVKIMCIG